VQCEQKENKRKAAEHDEGLEKLHGPPDEDVNDVEVFRDFHTSSKKVLSDTAKAAVVSTFFLFSLKSTEAIAIKEENIAGA
jgi:hypothetical protein